MFLLVVLIFASGKHRDLQRITVPYARILGVIDKDVAPSDDVSAMDTAI